MRSRPAVFPFLSILGFGVGYIFLSQTSDPAFFTDYMYPAIGLLVCSVKLLLVFTVQNSWRRRGCDCAFKLTTVSLWQIAISLVSALSSLSVYLSFYFYHSLFAVSIVFALGAFCVFPVAWFLHLRFNRIATVAIVLCIGGSIITSVGWVPLTMHGIGPIVLGMCGIAFFAFQGYKLSQKRSKIDPNTVSVLILLTDGLVRLLAIYIVIFDEEPTAEFLYKADLPYCIAAGMLFGMSSYFLTRSFLQQPFHIALLAGLCRVQLISLCHVGISVCTLGGFLLSMASLLVLQYARESSSIDVPLLDK